MTDNKEKKNPRSRVKNGSYTSFIVLLTAAALCTAGFYFYIKQPSSDRLQEQTAPLTQAQKNHKTAYSRGDQTASQETAKEVVVDQKNSDSVSYSQSPGASQQSNEASLQSSSPYTDTPDNSKSVNGSPETDTYVQQLIAEINAFYGQLDSRTYMKKYNLDKPSKEYFSNLIQKLVDNPPVVSRETDDLFTLLKNTAHLFRILGKENILMLKGILDREKESFENVLKSFYSLTKYPKSLAEEYSLSIPPESLYDYAGFFLTTMGGRLYLFRRDSTSRMTVSFYAILIIDRFKDAGSDRHGLDLVQPINSLIEEIENAGNRLRLKNEYLDILYDLKEKYSR